MFATRAGRVDLPAICIGSHLDTQPTGNFDGVLGVLGGLEVLRTLQAGDYRAKAPIMRINWTNEEGSRACLPQCSRPASSPACSRPITPSRRGSRRPQIR